MSKLTDAEMFDRLVDAIPSDYGRERGLTLPVAAALLGLSEPAVHALTQGSAVAPRGIGGRPTWQGTPAALAYGPGYSAGPRVWVTNLPALLARVPDPDVRAALEAAWARKLLTEGA